MLTAEKVFIWAKVAICRCYEKQFCTNNLAQGVTLKYVFWKGISFLGGNKPLIEWVCAYFCKFQTVQMVIGGLTVIWQSIRTTQILPLLLKPHTQGNVVFKICWFLFFEGIYRLLYSQFVPGRELKLLLALLFLATSNVKLLQYGNTRGPFFTMLQYPRIFLI